MGNKRLNRERKRITPLCGMRTLTFCLHDLGSSYIKMYGNVFQESDRRAKDHQEENIVSPKTLRTNQKTCALPFVPS